MAKDPTQVPVQLNIKVPWSFKHFLERKSEATNVSQNRLVVEALLDKYGTEYRDSLVST